MSSQIYVKKIKHDEIKDQELVGHGAVAKIYKATVEGRIVAVKDFLEHHTFERELKNLEKLQGHKNIIKVFGVVSEHVSKFGLKRMLIMELATTDVANVLYDVDGVKEVPVLRWAKELAAGGAFIHSKGMIHFDLKPENLLLDKDWVIKINDFGISRRPESLKAEQGATVLYCAPEIISQEAAKLTNAVDVYSYAIILWEFLHRKPAFGDSKISSFALLKEVVMNKARPPISVTHPEEMINLMKSCWDADPAARPTFGDAIRELKKVSDSHVF